MDNLQLSNGYGRAEFNSQPAGVKLKFKPGMPIYLFRPSMRVWYRLPELIMSGKVVQASFGRSFSSGG
jgi:hypothetical protein